MSDIIYTPPVTGGGGGTTINPTNNFIPVRSNATTFIDSNLYNVANTFLYSQNFGFNIDYASSLIQLGEYVENTNGTILSIDDTNQFISTYNQGQQNGLKLDFANNVYFLGDFNGVSGTNSSLTIDNNNGTIYTQGYLSEDGIKIDFSTKQYFFGDFNVVGNGTYLQINDNNTEFRTYLGNTFVGFGLDYTSKTYNFGDFNSSNNGTYLSVRDNSKVILLNTLGGEISQQADLLRFTGSLTQPGASGPSPLGHLQVTINGTPCVIQLLNP